MICESTVRSVGVRNLGEWAMEKMTYEVTGSDMATMEELSSLINTLIKMNSGLWGKESRREIFPFKEYEENLVISLDQGSQIWQ